MPNQTPTLAEVLTQYAAACIGDESTEDTERSLSIARAAALQYILANREWLERAAWENHVRTSVGCDLTVPVITTRKSLRHPMKVAIDRFEVGEPSWQTVIVVGADWKPEAQGG
jgi:5-methylcytosine-specific restriction endonuclease McrA